MDMLPMTLGTPPSLSGASMPVSKGKAYINEKEDAALEGILGKGVPLEDDPKPKKRSEPELLKPDAKIADQIAQMTGRSDYGSFGDDPEPFEPSEGEKDGSDQSDLRNELVGHVTGVMKKLENLDDEESSRLYKQCARFYKDLIMGPYAKVDTDDDDDDDQPNYSDANDDYRVPMDMTSIDMIVGKAEQGDLDGAVADLLGDI